MQIDDLNGEITIARHALTVLVDDVALKVNESVTLKKLSQSVTNRLQQQRYKNRLAAKDVIDKEEAVERIKRFVEALQQKLKRFSDKNWDSQERLRSLDELIELEEKNMSKIATENTRLGASLYRMSKMLTELKAEHKVHEVKQTRLILNRLGINIFCVANRWRSTASKLILFPFKQTIRKWNSI